MTARQTYQNLMQRYAELVDLGNAAGLLSWDQETLLPRKGGHSRALQLATLAGIRHQLLTAPEVGDWLSTCEAAAGEFDELESSQVRELRRDFDKSTRVPRELVQEIAQAQSEALEVWRGARPANDFAAFAPHQEKLLGLTRRKAEAVGFEDQLYDALLDEYERDATTRYVEQLFGHLREQLTPLVLAVLERRGAVDPACARKNLDPGAQGRFGDAVIEKLGFDLEAGRVDLSAHPFCSGLGHGDVRLTRRFVPGDWRPALYGIVHEAGHGMYEQGLPAEWDRTPLGSAVSLGVHESQSRLWENMVGRSLPFWEHFLPALRQHFPGEFDSTAPEELFRAVNQVQTSLIRVEADELTYNLHVVLRFEIERALFGGDLKVADLPGAWREQMRQLLGVEPPDDRDGCLQDIHWSMGAFGYFPTYTLGNLYAAQLMEAVHRDLPDLDDQLHRGEFSGLLGWLRERVHHKGRLLTPAQLLESATGNPPSPEPFLTYVKQKFGRIYGV